ncbi:MAG TPA: metallophosphoesterase [Beijerinckiaceae bacterium]|jgi:DNA repair exonuclease SbcCD nuclease subunit
MREIVLVHTSDVHVDDEYTARQFGGDGVGPLRLVLDAARAARADALLLVGDTFERHRLPESLIVETARALAGFGGRVVVLPGNHDPAVADAVYHHPALRALDHVCVLGVTHEEAVLFPEHDLEIWGRAHRAYGDMDPLAAPRPRSTRWQVALAHGHFEPAPDRSRRARPSWLVGADEVAATGADYVAFGHWNRPVRLETPTVPAYYSGSPDYAGTVNVVRLGAQGVAVERAPLDLPAALRATS